MKRRLLSICLMCILVLSGCGKGETEEQDIQIPAEPENTKYKMEELILPDFFSAQEEEHEFEYEEEKDALFDGFVSDLQGKPAVYASSFTLEEEEYLADIARWTLKENKDWKEDHLCQNSLSEFLNLKYEQEHWTRFTLDQFRRGDDGSLYGIFCYYIEGKSEVDGEMVEMVDLSAVTESYTRYLRRHFLTFRIRCRNTSLVLALHRWKGNLRITMCSKTEKCCSFTMKVEENREKS